MTVKSTESAGGGAPVPAGRLACPSCGALLAAVAGGPPPPVRVIETPSPDESAGEVTPPPASAKSRARTAPRANGKEPVTREHAGKPSASNGTVKQATPV